MNSKSKSDRWSIFVVAVMGTALFAAGCGKNTTGAIPVKGKLLVDGKPFGPASIALRPASPDEKLPHASGSVAADGTFTLKSGKGVEGAVPGRYVVDVSEDVMTGKGVPMLEPLTVEIPSASGRGPLELEVAMRMKKSRGKRRHVKAGPGTIEEKTKKRGPGGI